MKDVLGSPMMPCLTQEGIEQTSALNSPLARRSELRTFTILSMVLEPLG